MGNFQWRWALADVVAWLAGAAVASEVRFELAAGMAATVNYLLVGAIAAALQVLVGLALRQYGGRYRAGTFDDFRNLSLTTACVAVLVSVPLVVLQPVDFPRSMGISMAIVAWLFMIAGRATHRIVRERYAAGQTGTQRVILFGAGEAGEQLARSIRRDPVSHYNVVAFLDDAPQHRNLRLEGVPVKGTREDLGAVARETGAQTMIVAIASADARLLNDLAERAARADVHLLVLPPVSQLMGHSAGVTDIREVDEADLLGRAVVHTDASSISDMVHGKRILITGAGGSIGSELARKLHPFGPARMFLLDRDESALHAVQLSIHGIALLEAEDLVLADIRDAERIDQVFAMHRPEIVFHAAALKHLPLLEHAPQEAVKTNVSGSANVLAAAEQHGVEVFVNISTDKAADPTSVLGFSKRITERLTAASDTRGSGRYLSVRFGNVLGSRGSMLDTFTHQIARGGPVTVTHPDVTRFFMTIPEAVLLVLQASVVGRGGEVLILDMGDPVRIADVAQRLIRHSGRRVEIIYSGLRQGEKLHEDLLSDDEAGSRPFHPKITHVEVEPLHHADFGVTRAHDHEATKALLVQWSVQPGELSDPDSDNPASIRDSRAQLPSHR